MRFRAKIESFFSFARLSDWMVRVASKPIREVHDLLHEAYAQILQDSTILDGMTMREYEEFAELVRRLTKLKAIYEKASYFDNKAFENLLGRTLDLSYMVESEIRIVAFKGKKRIKTDDELKESLTLVSQQAIQTKLQE